jgi:hypothetical protein
MLIAFTLLTLASMDGMLSDDEDGFPACAIAGADGAPAASRHRDQFNIGSHTMPLDSDEDEVVELTAPDLPVTDSATTSFDVMGARASRDEPMHDGRGRHNNRGAHIGYAQQAYEHLKQVEEYSLGRMCQTDEAVVAKATSLQAYGLSAVVVGQLCFALTPEPEGEFSVGLVRIEKKHSDETVDLAWWVRTGTADRWPITPTFKPYMPAGKVEKQSKVKLESLLSVPVELTPKSGAEYKPDAKSIAGQSVRLSKDCTVLLRTFLEIHRTDLINDTSGSQDEDDSSEHWEEGSADDSSDDRE